MSEMVERVAKAMCGSAGTDWSYTSPSSYAPAMINRQFWLRMAREAIQAMREPTQDMIDAVDLSTPTDGQIIDTWDSMIDAALGVKHPSA